jgi:hypothetical protein
MFIGHGPSDLAADRVVNVFHFTTTDDYAIGSAKCLNAVYEFYTQTTPGAGRIGELLSPWIQRDAELRSYQMTLPKNERVPTVYPMTLPTGSAQGWPEETCLCLSVRGAPPAGPRKRGRIFLGPLNVDAVLVASTTNPTRPSQALRDNVLLHAKKLVDTADIEWCIRSTRPSENYVPIVSGYVDNAFDNQLRRGPDATERWEFTAA